MKKSGGQGRRTKEFEPRLIYTRDHGDRFDVEVATLKNGSRPAEDFILGLENKLALKIMARIERFAQLGIFKNKIHIKKLEDEIYEFKDNTSGVRIFWYYAPPARSGRIVLTHGFLKNEQKTNPQELVRTKRIRDEYEREVIHGIH